MIQTRIRAGNTLRLITQIPLLIILVTGLVLEAYPLLYMLINSVKTDRDIISNPFGLPSQIRFDNYVEVWKGTETGLSFGIYTRNSVFVTALSLGLIVFFASLAAYALARGSFTGKRALQQIFFLSLAVPAHVLMVPVYFMMGAFNLRDNLFGLVFMYSTLSLPFSVLILKAYFSSFPRELEESAVLDGCTLFGTFIRIVMPISRGALVCVAIVEGVWIWGELFFSLVLISSSRLRTMPLGIALLKSIPYTPDVNIALRFTAMCLSAIPIFFVFVFFQRYIIKGMTMGSFR